MLRCHFFFAITLTHIMDQLGIRDTSFHQLHNVSLFLFLHRSLSVRSTTRRSVDVYLIRIDLYERSTRAWILYDFSFNLWSTLFKKIGVYWWRRMINGKDRRKVESLILFESAELSFMLVTWRTCFVKLFSTFLSLLVIYDFSWSLWNRYILDM